MQTGRILAHIFVLERFLLNYLELRVFLHEQVLTPRGMNYHGKLDPERKGTWRVVPSFSIVGPKAKGWCWKEAVVLLDTESETVMLKCKIHYRLWR